MYLQNFDPSEFKNKHGDWWPKMSARLLVMLDIFRYQIGSAIIISTNPDNAKTTRKQVVDLPPPEPGIPRQMFLKE